jgi:spore germination protein YaaH
MGRLGVVTAPWRNWRPYAVPVAFLLAVTLVVALVRNGIHHSGNAPAKPRAAKTHGQRVVPKRAAGSVYVVRAGDTLTAIAAKTGIPPARLAKLNPEISPTALFIGEKIHLR